MTDPVRELVDVLRDSYCDLYNGENTAGTCKQLFPDDPEGCWCKPCLAADLIELMAAALDTELAFWDQTIREAEENYETSTFISWCQDARNRVAEALKKMGEKDE